MSKLEAFAWVAFAAVLGTVAGFGLGLSCRREPAPAPHHMQSLVRLDGGQALLLDPNLGTYRWVTRQELAAAAFPAINFDFDPKGERARDGEAGICIKPYLEKGKGAR